MVFIDTNFFLRFFLKDIKAQYLKAKYVFIKGAKKEEELVTSTIVIFEVFWVLSSFYHYSREEVSKIIKDILKMTFIQINERFLLLEALDIFDKTNLSLGDSYDIAFSRALGIKVFKTFDIKLGNEFEKIVGKKKA